MDEKTGSRILAEAMHNYADWIGSNQVLGAFNGLLSNDYVYVTVKLNAKGRLFVEEGPDVDSIQAENLYLENQVKEKTKEIKSLNILLDEQTTKPVGEILVISDSLEPITLDEPQMTPGQDLTQPVEPSKKKKRSRKKK